MTAKPTLILHIGMHKTGSSAIQRFLSMNRWVLRRLGVFYPPSIGPDGHRQSKHNAIFAAISHEGDKGCPHPQLGPSAARIAETADAIIESGARKAILSAEGFSGERPIFAEALRPLTDRFDVRVVAFLRRRDLWVESFYKQMVQNREVHEGRLFHDFLNAPATRRHMDYLTILSWWAEVFGEKAVSITPFEAGAGEPVPLFLAAAGLSRHLGLLAYSKGAVNVSPTAEVTEILRHANRMGLRLNRDQAAMIEGQIGKTQGAFLTEAERAALNAPYLEDDITIARRFTGRGRSTLFAHTTAPSRAEPWRGIEDTDPRLAVLEPFKRELS